MFVRKLTVADKGDSLFAYIGCTLGNKVRLLIIRQKLITVETFRAILNSTVH